MTEIQGNVAKRGKRNAISRRIHAKDDHKAIGTWRSDLDRILHVFNVRSTVSVWISLTVNLQTELAVNTLVVVSDVRHGVVGTHAMVSDIHRSVMRGQEGAGNQRRLVSDT